MATKAIRKGDQFTDAQGGVYTVHSLNIKNQAVIYNYEKSGEGVLTNHRPIADWLKLVSAASEAATPELPQIGTKFQMMDKSGWEITEESVVIVSGKREQTLSTEQYQELLTNGHIKILS